ncbi:MAG: flavin reductase family protein [Kiritimatiellae bacterium]|nr:flavin reductase family protein [Kiritimatiellia bacterium]
MAKVAINPFRPVYPTPAALITSVAADGKPNIVTLGEVFNLSLRTPPVVGIAIRKATYSHGLLMECGEYVVNMPTVKLMTAVDGCGSVSGREVDKFARFGLTPVPASRVKPPLIAECPVNIECRIIGTEEIGDHDLFKGEVVAAHADAELLDGGGRVCADRLDPLCFLYNLGCKGEYWSLGRKLGSAWAAKKK